MAIENIGIDRGALHSETGSEKARSDHVVLDVESLCKSFDAESAVTNLSLRVTDGELVTLLGPSGCGKTTTLRLLAGLERPETGTIRIDGTLVTDGKHGIFVPPEERDVGVVFQDFALFPHLTAEENVAFGIADWPEDERTTQVEKLLSLVDLTDQRDSYPDELSGGQQQRVALARSLAPEPEIILLDEPFSNLDVDLRVRMREEVRRILKETGVTAISVTHDQEEALSVSDRVAVMHRGRIEQIGTPEEVFQRPTSRFTAGFLGHASFLSGYVSGDTVETALGSVGRDQIHGLAPEYDHTRIDVLVRPDDVIARPADEDEANGTITYRRYLGPSVLYRAELENGDTVECMHNHVDRVDLDEPVSVELAAAHDLAWFPTEDQSR